MKNSLENVKVKFKIFDRIFKIKYQVWKMSKQLYSTSKKKITDEKFKKNFSHLSKIHVRS